MKKPKVFILVGATASGKTNISLELAKRFPIEIINADSLQVVRRMNIGTAKPSENVLANVPHHLIDIIDPDQEFTAKQYRDLAEEKILTLCKNKKIPLLVGGAGFYLKALVQPIEPLPTGTNYIENFIEAYAQILEKDPQIAKTIHPNDHYRISRASFLLDHGFIPSQSFQTIQELPFEIQWFGLTWERELLKKRIGQRVRQMFDAGLVEETESVLKDYPGSENRLQATIGYRESLDVIRKRIIIDKAIELTTYGTQQYAKRQGTWFRKNPNILWSSVDEAVSRFSFSIEGSEGITVKHVS